MAMMRNSGSLLFFFLFSFLWGSALGISGYVLDSLVQMKTYDMYRFAATQIPGKGGELVAVQRIIIGKDNLWYWTPTKLNNGHGNLGPSTILLHYGKGGWYNAADVESAQIMEPFSGNPQGTKAVLKFTTLDSCSSLSRVYVYVVCDSTVPKGTSFFEYWWGDLWDCDVDFRLRTNCTDWVTPYSPTTTKPTPTTSLPTTKTPTTKAPTTKAPTTPIITTSKAPVTLVQTTSSPSTTSRAPTTTTGVPSTIQPQTTVAPETTQVAETTSIPETTESPLTEEVTTEIPAPPRTRAPRTDPPITYSTTETPLPTLEHVGRKRKDH
eukprot:TRINITY_DN3398_c0_g1_i2.p1 TRINITY_DN3398_c0_g1~~TRINITY_DN3398_c0_g1_i2.p1  ORF type:complete len:323 (+),score=42.00 TRINITY_DN3398_c0_g1_i2:158-1126(+)